jgi:hypothetical protein
MGMTGKTIEINQTGDHFTLEQVEGRRRNVLFSKGPGSLGYQWWLSPQLNLPAELKTLGCSDMQIRQALKHLTSGKDTHLEFKVPR